MKKDVNTMTPTELRNLANDIENKERDKDAVKVNEIVKKYRGKIKPIKGVVDVGDAYAVEIKYYLDAYSYEYPNAEITKFIPSKQVLDFYKSIGYSKIDMLEAVSENLWNDTKSTLLDISISKSKPYIAMMKILKSIDKDCRDAKVNYYQVIQGIFK